MFGKEDRHQEVNRVMAGVIAKMESLGATIIRFNLPEYDTRAPSTIRGSGHDRNP
jgi:amidase